MPLATAANPLAPLPGQKLRSAKANRIDDVLTRSREASPELMDSGMPVLDVHALDMADPERSLTILRNHADALRQWFDTLQAERENLRFQVRLLEEDEKAGAPDEVLREVKRLETENRNMAAVESENAQLKARLEELEREEAALTRGSGSKRGATSAEAATDSQALDELKWENRLLEKRLERLTSYTEQLRSGTPSSRAQGAQPAGVWSPATTAVAESALEAEGSAAERGASSAAPGSESQDVELSQLIAENESMLQKVRSEIRVQTANISRPVDRSDDSEIAGARNSHARGNAVDVLTLDAAAGGRDVEWHVAAGPR